VRATLGDEAVTSLIEFDPLTGHKIKDLKSE